MGCPMAASEDLKALRFQKPSGVFLGQNTGPMRLCPPFSARFVGHFNASARS